MFEWIKNHKKLSRVIAIIVIGTIIGIPFLIHLLFNIRGTGFWVANWCPGDALSYGGDVLSFLGTVILGALALWQNDVIKKESEKREAILERMELDKYKPLFKVEEGTYSGQFIDYSLKLTNIYSNVAHGIEITNLEIKEENGKILFESKKVNINSDYLKAGDEARIEIGNKHSLSNNAKITFKVTFDITCIDIINTKWHYKVTSGVDYIGKTMFTVKVQ